MGWASREAYLAVNGRSLGIRHTNAPFAAPHSTPQEKGEVVCPVSGEVLFSVSINAVLGDAQSSVSGNATFCTTSCLDEQNVDNKWMVNKKTARWMPPPLPLQYQYQQQQQQQQQQQHLQQQWMMQNQPL
jgi:hypothetical protein